MAAMHARRAISRAARLGQALYEGEGRWQERTGQAGKGRRHGTSVLPTQFGNQATQTYAE